MSLSSETYEHHLTPFGWIEGSSRLDFCKENFVPRPHDALLTVKEHRKTSHWKADEDVDCYEIWKSTDSKALETAISKFGARPFVLPGFEHKRL